MTIEIHPVAAGMAKAGGRLGRVARLRSRSIRVAARQGPITHTLGGVDDMQAG